MEDQDVSDVERYYARLCSELDMIRSGPVLAGPRTIEHIRSLLALIDLHRPNEFDVCLGCDRLWPCASVLAVSGRPPELPAADQDVAVPRPLPGATRRPRAATGASTGAFPTVEAPTAAPGFAAAAALTDAHPQPAARGTAPMPIRAAQLAELPANLAADLADRPARRPDRDPLTEPRAVPGGRPLVASDGRLTPGALPDPPPARAANPATANTVGRGVLIPAVARQAPPPPAPPQTAQPMSPPAARAGHGGQGGQGGASFADSGATAQGFRDFDAPPGFADPPRPAAARSDGADRGAPPPTGPMPHIPPPGESYLAFPPPEAGGANPAFPPPGTTAAGFFTPAGATGAHPILPPPGMTGALPVFPPPVTDEGSFSQGRDVGTGAHPRYQPPAAPRPPTIGGALPGLQPPGPPAGAQRPVGLPDRSSRPSHPADPGSAGGPGSPIRDTRGRPTGGPSFRPGGRLAAGGPPTPPPGSGLPGLSAAPGTPGQPTVPGQSGPPNHSGPRQVPARSGYGAQGPAASGSRPPGPSGQGLDGPGGPPPNRTEQARRDLAYPGYPAEPPGWSAGRGGQGDSPPTGQPGGAPGTFGPVGASGLPGSIDPRLRQPAGPPRGQSRSISAPPPPHRSIHPEGIDPVTGRPKDPTARRLGPPVPDDVTPEWMSRRDPILDGIDVI